MCVDTRDGQSGSVYFTHSTEMFANAGIGDDAEIDLMVAFDGAGLSTPVVIHWVDWNHFLWKAIGKATVIDEVPIGAGY